MLTQRPNIYVCATQLYGALATEAVALMEASVLGDVCIACDPHYSNYTYQGTSWGNLCHALSHMCVSSPFQDKLPFAYDLEHVIDDWILMGFLMGNDFIPHLPNMHIRQVCEA